MCVYSEVERGCVRDIDEMETWLLFKGALHCHYVIGRLSGCLVSIG